MRTLYLECNMGAAGDMLSAALLELLPEVERAPFVDKLNGLGLPGVTFAAEPAVKCGVTGTHMRVAVNGEEEQAYYLAHGHVHDHEHTHPHEHTHSHEHSHEHEHEHGHPHVHSHHHAGMHDIQHLVSHMSLHPDVERDVLGVYGLIAQAESHAHGVPVEEIHFHEVGALDAVADVTAVCMLMRALGPRQVVCSPVHVGSGQVRCAHGILPVPAPATAHILQGVPTYGGEIPGELCTPTGAALLKWFVNSFGPSPIMRVERVGYGMGTKDFPAMNGVRAMLGETADSTADTVAELSCNLDDMTPEAIAFAAERLMEAGALDAFTTAIGMKKGRPGVMLTCLCRPEDREAMTRLLFSHTTTLGVREQLCGRQVLSRAQEQRQTPFGTVTVKVSEGWGVRREKPEYEDLARIAKEQGMSLEETRKKLEL